MFREETIQYLKQKLEKAWHVNVNQNNWRLFWTTGVTIGN